MDYVYSLLCAYIVRWGRCPEVLYVSHGMKQRLSDELLSSRRYSGVDVLRQPTDIVLYIGHSQTGVKVLSYEEV